MEELLALGYRRINEEVYYAPPAPCSMTMEVVEKLGVLASHNSSGKARICFHQDQNDLLHDMLIALDRSAKIKPHLHLRKLESFQVIVGAMAINLFDEQGRICKKIELTAESGAAFYFKLPPKIAHTVMPLTDLVIFREVTNGPFCSQDTIYPAWSLKNGK